MKAGPRSSPLWLNADFLKLWSAQTVSVTGSTLGAIQFTAVLTLDATPAQMALVTASGLVPALLFGLAIGALVDRLPRRPILIAADLGRMGLLGSIPVAWAFDALIFPHLYIVAFFHGLLTIVFEVSYRSYLPALVAPDQLVGANSRLSASDSAAEVGAFSLGGWLAQLFSAVTVAAVDAASFLVSALLLARIRRGEDAPVRSAGSPGARREITDGLRLVVRHPLLRSILVSKAALGLGSGIIGTLIVLFAIDTLGLAPGVFGTIAAIGGVSSILGALSVGKLTRLYGPGRTLAVGFLVWGVSGFLIPLARGSLLLAGMFLAAQQLFDFGVSVYQINEVSLRQGVTSRQMLGRVNASMEVAVLSSELVGALLAALLAESVGIRWALAAGSGIMTAGGLWLLLSPVWRIRSLADAQRDYDTVAL